MVSIGRSSSTQEFQKVYHYKQLVDECSIGRQYILYQPLKISARGPLKNEKTTVIL